jgi:alpha-D-xyloside xylohydrolase
MTLKVFPGSDGDFDLYRDDGSTYDYEQGKSETTHLHWNDATGKLNTTGAKLPAGSAARVEVVGKTGVSMR